MSQGPPRGRAGLCPWPVPDTPAFSWRSPFLDTLGFPSYLHHCRRTAIQLMPVQCWWVVTVQCWWEGSFIASLWLLLLKSSSNDWGTSDSLDFRSLHFGVSWSASLIAHTSRCALHTRCFSRSGEVTGFLVSDLLLCCPPYGPLVPHVQVGYLLKTGSISKVVLLCSAWPSSGTCQTSRGGGWGVGPRCSVMVWPVSPPGSLSWSQPALILWV